MQRPESKTLVVFTTVLQLGLVMLVWLLALLPAMIAALAVLTYKTVRRLLGGAPSASNAREGFRPRPSPGRQR